jgi:hypothetical protein
MEMVMYAQRKTKSLKYRSTGYCSNEEFLDTTEEYNIIIINITLLMLMQ